ncbi:hypothetical protein [Escherichia coli]|nr:hypothetical protein [Escherichia coli]
MSIIILATISTTRENK